MSSASVSALVPPTLPPPSTPPLPCPSGLPARNPLRRAAHFANYQNEDEEDEGDAAANAAHVGGSAARTLGPWSSAVELANAREAALNARQEKLQAGQLPAEPKVVWTPSRDVNLGPR